MMRMGASKAPADSSPLLTSLPEDLVVALLGWVPTDDLLRSVSLVSKQFAAVCSRDEAFWRCRHREAASSTGEVRTSTALTLHQMQRCCLLIDLLHHRTQQQAQTAPLEGGDDALQSHVHSLLVYNPTRCFPIGMDARVFLATTTDRTPIDISQLTIPRGFSWSALRSGTYWRSAPSSSSDEPDVDGGSSEVLLFAFSDYQDALISDLAIKPFKECGPNGEITYSWPAIVVRVYHLPAKQVDDTFNSRTRIALFPFANSQERGQLPGFSAESRRELISSLLACRVPAYESPRRAVPCPHSDAWQHFRLPPGVVGNVVTFELLGKNHRKDTTARFYVGVDQVVVAGIWLPLHP